VRGGGSGEGEEVIKLLGGRRLALIITVQGRGRAGEVSSVWNGMAER